MNILPLRHALLTIVTLSIFTLHGNSFTIPYQYSHHTGGAFRNQITTTTLHYSSPNNPFSHNIQRTSLRQFLTQRSVQSFMFLATQLRDPHTSGWIERFIGSGTGLMEFHGTGGFNLTRWGEWDTVFLEMMEREEESIVLQARNRVIDERRKKNPLLDEKFFEYEIKIDPKSISSRIIAVREQIADELTRDLDVVSIHNSEVISSIHTRIPNNTISPMSHLENSVNFSHTPSSPFRKGNFDLLLLLTLQEAVHRTLRRYSQSGTEKAVSREWLSRFYKEVVGEYFDGNGKYGRAVEFVERLMGEPPRVVTDKESGAGGSKKTSMGLVDPLRIMEDILVEREKVTREWQVIARGVKEEHSGLRKALLTRRWLVEEKEKEMGTMDEVWEGFQ